MVDKRVAIATPMYGGMCSGLFAKSLVEASFTLANNGVSSALIDLYNESLINRARNTLTHAFLQSGADTLLFIDADQSFRGSDILRMLSYDKEIIGAPVPMKSINWDNVIGAANNNQKDLENYSGNFNINFIPGTDLAEDLKTGNPIRVLYVGTGMMMIKKSVFEKLNDSVHEYSYDGPDISSYGIRRGDRIKNFWDTAIVNDRLLSEDYNFCSMWSNIGGDIYVDPLAQSRHVGNYVFSGKLLN